MANEEHLKILRQGVEAWNEWRKEDRKIEPDLSHADISKADLRHANLIGANLSYAKLIGVFLGGAFLSGANLSYANLSDAKLGDAILREAILIGANLSGAYLRGANLSYADLRGAFLRDALLRDAFLRGAHLSEANLSRANLGESDLLNASLQAVRLIDAKLDGANITEACLWETQRSGWSIKDIICESVYWDKYAKEKTTYAPGEFERLFADKTRVKLHYKDDISILEIAALPALIEYLAEMEDCSLRFVAISQDAGGTVVELAIENTDDKSPEEVKELQSQLQLKASEVVEYERKLLTEERQRLQLEGRLDELRFWFKDQLLLLATSNQITNQGVITMSNKTFHVSGQSGVVGDHGHAHDNTFNKISDSQVQQNSPGAIQNVTISTFNPDELNRLLKTLKDSLDQITLDDDKKSELQSDLTTLEVQIASPKPKAAIIRETLYSIRNILEGAAGSGVAAGIIYEIARLLQ